MKKAQEKLWDLRLERERGREGGKKEGMERGREEEREGEEREGEMDGRKAVKKEGECLFHAYYGCPFF